MFIFSEYDFLLILDAAVPQDYNGRCRTECVQGPLSWFLVDPSLRAFRYSNVLDQEMTYM